MKAIWVTEMVSKNGVKARVAALAASHHFWPELSDLTRNFGCAFIDLSKHSIQPKELFFTFRYMNKFRLSFGWALFAARVELSGARVFLGVDNRREALKVLRMTHPDIPQVVVAHGPIRRDSLERSHTYLTDGHPNRTLLVWGTQDGQMIRETFGPGVTWLAVGSVRNAYFNRIKSSRVPAPHTELTLVSNYAPGKEVDENREPDRARVIALMKQHLARYCRENNVSLRIALRPEVSSYCEPGQWDEERAHYQEVFSEVDVSFTDPAARYSTYFASDASNVTLGLPSGALTESFGRGNKVLMIGVKNGQDSVFGFPVTGPWLLSEPDYDQFAMALTTRRAIDIDSYRHETNSIRGRILRNAEDTETIASIQGRISGFLE